MRFFKISAAAIAAAMVLPVAAQAITITPDPSNTLVDGVNHILPGSFDYTANVSSDQDGVDTDTATVSFQLSSATALSLDVLAAASTLELPGGSMDLTRVALTTGEDFGGSVILDLAISSNGSGTVEFADDTIVLTPADFASGVWYSVSVSNVVETQQLNAQIMAEEAAVPLPASAFLLLGALGGLGFVRSRSRA